MNTTSAQESNATKAESKMGQPPHAPTKATRAEVQRLSGVGITQFQIATLIGIDVKTLVKHYRDDLDMGVAKADSTVASCLYKKAVEGDDLGAMVWWSKTRLRWAQAENKPEDQNINLNIRDWTVKVKK